MLSFFVCTIGSWVLQIGKPHIPEKFSAYPVCDAVYHLRAVIRRVDVDTKRALPERCIHDFHNRVRYFGYV